LTFIPVVLTSIYVSNLNEAVPLTFIPVVLTIIAVVLTFVYVSDLNEAVALTFIPVALTKGKQSAYKYPHIFFPGEILATYP